MTPSTLNQLQVLLKNQLSLFVAFHAFLLSLFFFFFPFFKIYICPSVPHSLPRFFLHLSVSSITFLSVSPAHWRTFPCPLAGAALGRARRAPGGGTQGRGAGEDRERGGHAGSHASSPQDAVPPLKLRGETLPPSRHPLIPLWLQLALRPPSQCTSCGFQLH